MNKRDRYHYLQGKIDHSFNHSELREGKRMIYCQFSKKSFELENYTRLFKLEQSILLNQMGLTRSELLNDIKD